MPLNIFYDPIFLKHNTGKIHPENKERINACINGLKNCHFSNKLNWKIPRFASENEIKLIHSNQHIKNIKKICESGGGKINFDTILSKESYKAALKSAGAWLSALDEVINNKSSFVISRPPGHHAEKNKAMGFCIFSNAALAAIKAIQYKNINKVTIFDWDVHHGNGTQNIIQNYSNIKYVSIHQYPFYPGTGIQSNNKNILNIPLPAGINSTEYLNIFENIILPFIYQSNPDILIISAGFDAHFKDPLANFNLQTEDFSYMTKKLREIKSTLLIGLEGGYDLQALKECSIAVANQLL